MNLGGDFGTDFIAGGLDIEGCLQADPKLGRCSKIPSEPERRIGADSAAPIDDIADAHLWHTDGLGQSGLA